MQSNIKMKSIAKVGLSVLLLASPITQVAGRAAVILPAREALASVEVEIEDIKDDFPEIIPGPGLPSLAFLNLTSAELFAMPIPASALLGAPGSISERALEKRASCYDPRLSCDINSAVYNYLARLGTLACSGTGLFSLCYVGACSVQGRSRLGPNAFVASYCEHVAFGVSVVAYNCPHDDSHAGAGTDVAYGNGDFIVSLADYLK
ncbi:hypothetical protein BKA65DRAFT_284 [Rhexocercosporidium sp. MPI-PUGE-AT-0058]|nr:hypothetical protein BKA65DRAFT_284 [Rhexocercosporidium sp. MPI-PUGE-AT-0058]